MTRLLIPYDHGSDPHSSVHLVPRKVYSQAPWAKAFIPTADGYIAFETEQDAIRFAEGDGEGVTLPAPNNPLPLDFVITNLVNLDDPKLEKSIQDLLYINRIMAQVFEALNVDKDGDGFICREAMPLLNQSEKLFRRSYI